jgi:RNA 3'-terminal phosphate cyclase (ATP)
MEEVMIVVDGSAGEGGGQVLRTALTLSTLTGRGVEVRNVRSGRPNPGLRPQHLAAVRAAAAICGAEVEGAELDSATLRFHPGKSILPGTYTFDVAKIAGRGSAGAVGLVLQTVLLPLALAGGDSELVLRGGTHVPWAPSVDYLERVFLPAMAQMGVTAQIELVAWGFYPAGGGEARVMIRGGTLKALRIIERGEMQRVTVRGVASNLPSHIAQRMVNRARNVLAEEGFALRVEPLRVRSTGPGAAAFLFAEYERVTAGFVAFGRKGLPSEHVADAVCSDMLAYHRTGAPVDPYLADQLLLPMALAPGTSEVVTSMVTDHLLTNIAVVRAFLPLKAKVVGKRGSPGTVTVRGSVND